MTRPRETDDVTGIETTGHEWDGIKELDNPLPRWWVGIFYACILGAIVFWVLYPSWPVWNGQEWTFVRGVIGTTPRDDVERAMARQAAQRARWQEQIEKTPLAGIVKNPELLEFALAGGKAAFGDNCAPCHGTGAQGGPGFPNLNDDEWLWGGTLTEIHQTITHGIRWESDPETHMSMMQGYLKDQILSREEVSDVVQYVLNFTGRASDPQAVKRGAQTFADICSACHGPDGKGNKYVGAPDLTNDIWLYGGDPKTIFETVANGRAGQMPSWIERLDSATIKELAIYVHSLGGGLPGEETAAAE